MSVLNNFTVSITRSLKSRLKKTKELDGAISRLISRRGSATKNDKHIKMEKCLIVSKVTRYEYEKNSYVDVSEEQLERLLRKRGSDYDAMLATHRQQKQFEQDVLTQCEKMGLEVKMATRMTYSDDLIKWCDVVVPCGGDGTFLLAASRVRDNTKPVIGFNSAPHKSVGRLCLPTWCSHDIQGALIALQEGKFRWMRRTRIRTTLRSDPALVAHLAPVDLHTLQHTRFGAVHNVHDDPTEMQQTEQSNSSEQSNTNQETQLQNKVLPFLALNEVFIGESVTSRVSLLRLQIDSGKWTTTKSSGLCVTTGTGSTSWHFSINCLRSHSVLELLRVLAEELPQHVQLDTSLERARDLAEKYNQKLMFAPDSDKLAYSVREYITFEEWPRPRGLRVRDFATTVAVKSHCIDAGLVIDGSVSFPFNDGTEALLEIHPEDALMTVAMDDELPH